MLSNIYINQLYELAPQTSTARFYITRYIKLINHFLSLNRKLKKKESHIHHIVPRSWKLDNSKANLIAVTPREHFILHMCLYMTRDYSMTYAFWIMTHTLSSSNIKRITGSLYEHLMQRIRIVWEDTRGQSVVDLHTGCVYKNINELSIITGIAADTIRKSINQNRKTKGKYYTYWCENIDCAQELQRRIEVTNQRYMEGRKKADSRENRAKAFEKNRVPVINLDTGEIFDSISLALEKYDHLNRSGIENSCKRKTRYKGWSWRYQNEQDVLLKQSRRKKNTSNNAVVINLNTKQVYNSLIEAAKDVGIVSGSNIVKSIKNNTKIKGCYWAYYTGPYTDYDEVLKQTLEKAEIRKATNLATIRKVRKEKPSKCKKVMCVETEIVYKSTSEASRQMGFKANPVWGAAKYNKICAGYHWKFVD